MRLKKLAKIFTVAMVTALAAAVCVAMSACSGAKTLTGSYSKHSYSHFPTEQVDWDQIDSYMLQLYSDNTYTLTCKTEYFGTDYEGRGLTEIVTAGDYSSVASADGDVSHLDLTLSAANTVIYSSSGKVASYSGGAGTLNTEKWNSAMTNFYATVSGAEYGSDEEAKSAFIDAYGAGYNVTIEEPSLDPENTSLVARIVTIEKAE